jgi:multicomponent Na+:H+ antiporter subunit B
MRLQFSVSTIQRTAARPLEVILLVLSVLMLLRGHNEPGGGFIGGLTAAGAFALHGLTHGVSSARRLLWVSPRSVAAWGLLAAVASGLLGLALGHSYLAGIWLGKVAGVGKLGTVLLFDVGVYMVVVGTVLAVLEALSETSAEEEP